MHVLLLLLEDITFMHFMGIMCSTGPESLWFEILHCASRDGNISLPGFTQTCTCLISH